MKALARYAPSGALAGRTTTPALRVAEVEGNVACLVLMWDARDTMPTVGGVTPAGGTDAGRTYWPLSGRSPRRTW